MSFRQHDKVIDKTRTQLYGTTQGMVVKAMGPYRTLVKWPDERGEQLEKNDDLKAAQ